MSSQFGGPRAQTLNTEEARELVSSLSEIRRANG